MKRKYTILLFIFTLLINLVACSKQEVPKIPIEQLATEFTELMGQYIPGISMELTEDDEYSFIVYREDNPDIYTSVDYFDAYNAVVASKAGDMQTAENSLKTALMFFACTSVLYDEITEIVHKTLPENVNTLYHLGFSHVNAQKYEDYLDRSQILNELTSQSDAFPTAVIFYLIDSSAIGIDNSRLEEMNLEIQEYVMNLLSSYGMSNFRILIKSALTEHLDEYKGFSADKAWRDYDTKYRHDAVETYYSPSSSPEPTQIPDYNLPEVLDESYYESFENKHYFEQLNLNLRSASLGRYVFNKQYLLYPDYIYLQGTGISLNYYFVDHLYNLILQDSYSYAEEGVEKKVEVVLSSACYEDDKIIYDGRLTTSEGQVFFISFDEKTGEILDDDEFSATRGQTIQLTKGLNDWLVSEFQQVCAITRLQYSICHQWEQEITQALNGEKELNSIKDANDVSLNNDNENSNVEVPYGDKVYFGNFEVNRSFDAIGVPPTYIRIIENDTIITWGVEAGLVINTENNPYGGSFTGFMTEIAKNIYAVEGEFFYLDYAGQYDNLVSEDVDFYIILKGNTLYGVFEPMSVSDLEKYIPSDVYKYGGDK